MAYIAPRLTTQILRYYSVGTLAVVLDVSVFQSLVFLATRAAIAAALAGPVAAAAHFTLNRNWSFQASHGNLVRQMMRYAVVYAAIWIVTVGIVAHAVEHLRLLPIEAKALALAVTIPMGFAGHKWFTYSNARVAFFQRETVK